MCGICGFISKQEINLIELREMNDTMCHRGPDDSGVEIYPLREGYHLGLAHRRLAVVDLSESGHQPMHSPDKRISVIYNGEIYNFRELKKELRDYPFCSDCDTEVIIAAYLKWGISCIEKFNGMFAIALFDRDTQECYLVRDRIGKKPLYYQLENGNLYFASELKPLMKRPGFEKNIDTGVLSRYLFQQYIAAPDSIFKNIRQLEPGAILKFHYGAAKTWKYWDITKVYHDMQKDPVTDYKQAKAELKELLKKAVSARMIADVPLGTFLSGGYDSSLISAMAQENTKEPVKTFSIGFHEERYNEAKYARAVAAHLGTDHTEVYIGEAEMFGLVDSIPDYYDEPFADSSQIATMLVSQLARNKVTVALSGDGGDEFFCGYRIYDIVKQAQRLDGLGAMTRRAYQLPGIRNLALERKIPLSIRTIAENRNPETKTQLASDYYVDCSDKMVRGDTLSCFYEMESKYQVGDWQIRRMLLDMETYLPSDILCKVDRAAMKYSLETRCPILDKDVMEYSFRMDHGLKYQKGNQKRILKDIAYDYIPRELLERPKVGFAVPLDGWLREALKEQLQEMSTQSFLDRQGIFDGAYTARLIQNYLQRGDAGAMSGRNYSHIVWAFFVFQKWYLKYIAI